MEPHDLPPSSQRVQEYSDAQINAQIERQIEANVAYYSRRLDDIERRLDELDQEWDIERTLEANAGAFSLVGLVLSMFSRKFLLFPLAVAAFLIQHAVQGWCPPVPIFRRLGVRTPAEIDKERVALKALRGDFDDVEPDEEDPHTSAADAIRASEMGRHEPPESEEETTDTEEPGQSPAW
ncbi:MAG: hypothetical protein ACOC93_04740 [Planctomycetota bacterium]